jgi:hypothetical protein
LGGKEVGGLLVIHHHHHHKHPGLGHLARSVSRVTVALSIISSVSRLFSFLVGCRLVNASNYPTGLKEKNMEKQKDYNLRYLLAKVRTTRGKASVRLRQRTNKRNINRVGRLPTSEQNYKIILSVEV